MSDHSSSPAGRGETGTKERKNATVSRRGLLGSTLVVAAGMLVCSLGDLKAEPVPEATSNHPFEIVIYLYSKGTLLDFAGPNEVFQQLSNAKVRFASAAGGPVTLEHGIVFGKTDPISEVQSCDLLLVPGGPDLTEPMKPENLKQIRRVADQSKYVTSVCTGSIVLAASGVLDGKRSSSHWATLNLLKEYGAIPDPARFVKDGRFMSGGGVTSGIDFALRVAAELRGPEEAQFIQLGIEYDPAPPFQSGHPRNAPKEAIAAWEKKLPGASKGLFDLPR